MYRYGPHTGDMRCASLHRKLPGMQYMWSVQSQMCVGSNGTIPCTKLCAFWGPKGSASTICQKTLLQQTPASHTLPCCSNATDSYECRELKAVKGCQCCKNRGSFWAYPHRLQVLPASSSTGAPVQSPTTRMWTLTYGSPGALVDGEGVPFRRRHGRHVHERYTAPGLRGNSKPP